MGDARGGGKKEPRKPTTYLVLVSPPAEESWTPTDVTVEARTRDEAERKATRALEAHATYSEKVTSERGYGVWLIRTAAYKPFIAVAEPQPVKVKKRAFKS